MAQIRITKKYVDPKYPNLPFEVGQIYDAALPFGGAYTYAPVQRVNANPAMYNIRATKSANLVTINVPKEYWEMFSVVFMPTPTTNPTQGATTQSSKSDKSTKYIILGIAVIGFISYLAMKGHKK